MLSLFAQMGKILVFRKLEPEKPAKHINCVENDNFTHKMELLFFVLSRYISTAINYL